MNFINQYPFVSVVLCFVFFFGAINLYFKLARRFNLIDQPNERSSHSKPTIVGAGVVFVLAFFVFELFQSFLYGSLFMPYIFTGTIMIAITSFIDDRKELPNVLRISIQFIAAALLLQEINILQIVDWWIVGLVLIVIVGTINAYNFMDGINGITGLYSLVTLATLYFLRKSSDLDMLYYSLALALLVFLFYNLRNKARCFCGDVGSVSLAFLLVFLLLFYMTMYEHWEAILILAVYGVDSVLTIIYRIRHKQNIFQAHRSHIYQLLVHRKGWSHIKVSSAYAIIQLIINAILVAILPLQWQEKLAVVLLVFALLTTISFALRRSLKT